MKLASVAILVGLLLLPAGTACGIVYFETPIQVSVSTPCCGWTVRPAARSKLGLSLYNLQNSMSGFGRLCCGMILVHSCQHHSCQRHSITTTRISTNRVSTNRVSTSHVSTTLLAQLCGNRRLPTSTNVRKFSSAPMGSKGGRCGPWAALSARVLVDQGRIPGLNRVCSHY
jgi:hypothetical protein